MINHNMLQYMTKTMQFKLKGELRQPQDFVGRTFTNPDGQRFVIFKQTILTPAGRPDEPAEAIFRVRFRVERLYKNWAGWLMALKSPMFVGFPGFRSKLWMVDEAACDYQGVYEWTSLADARAYATSESMALMKQLAIPGGVSYEIYPHGRLVCTADTVSILGEAEKELESS